MNAMLMERLKCNEKMASMIAGDLQQISPELQPLLDQWIAQGRCEDDTRYHDYSLNMLIEQFGMRFTGALLTLDWLIKEPDKAKAALLEPVK